MRIGKSARKHGVTDEDIWHAMRNLITSFEGRDIMINVGAACDGTLLEIGILGEESDDPLIIHAMPLRRSYYKYL